LILEQTDFSKFPARHFHVRVAIILPSHERIGVRDQKSTNGRDPITNIRVFVFRFFCNGCENSPEGAGEIGRGSPWGVSPSEVFPEARQRASALRVRVVPRIDFRAGMTMDQPDGARNLFRFRKRAEARIKFRTAQVCSGAEESIALNATSNNCEIEFSPDSSEDLRDRSVGPGGSEDAR